MAARRVAVSAAEIAQLRFEYEETATPVEAIAARRGWARSTFYARARAWGFGPRKYLQQRCASDAGPPAPGAALADQLQRTVERELDAIATILAKLPAGDERAAQAERAARTLASLTRTLNEVARLRREQAEAAPAHGAQDPMADDNDMPRDIDDFRRELARRIDAFVASRTHPGAADEADAADGGALEP